MPRVLAHHFASHDWGRSQLHERGLFVLVAEVGPHDTRLQVFKCPQVFDDVAASIIEEQFAILGAPDRDNPFKIVPVFKQIIDGLGNATAGDYRDFGAR